MTEDITHWPWYDQESNLLSLPWEKKYLTDFAITSEVTNESAMTEEISNWYDKGSNPLSMPWQMKKTNWFCYDQGSNLVSLSWQKE